MNTTDPDPEPSVPDSPDAPAPTPTSIWARMFNVYAAPGEVYEEVKASPPRTANWLVPVLLLTIVGCVATWLIFSQDAIVQQLRDQQEKQYTRMVEQGKMTAEQVEASRAVTERMGPILKIAFGFVAIVASSFASPFWAALLIWLVGARVFKGPVTYMKAVEVAGLSNMLDVLGALVRTPLIILMGNLSVTVGPMLLIRNFDLGNPLHGAIAAVDLFAVWQACVRGIGLSKLSGASVRASIGWMLALWVFFTALMLGIGFALQKLFVG